MVVEGKRVQGTDENNSFTCSFVWRFTLPPGVKESDLCSEVSSDGVLSFTAPLPQPKLSVQTVYSGLPKPKMEKKIKVNKSMK
jgi:hypothetical protein